MTTSLVTCPNCGSAMSSARFNEPDFAPCPSCGKQGQVEVFRALFQPMRPGHPGEQLLSETEASCFYHPQKRAVLPCDGCGRFLCALCDCELAGQHLCPVCLESGKRKGKIKNLQNQRTLYDGIALGLAIFPMIIFYITVLTAPMALYVGLRHWNSPGSLVRRGKVRLVVAIAIAVAQIIAWGGLAFYLISEARRNG